MESHMMGTAKQKAGEPGNLTVIAQQLNHANHRLPQTSPALKPGSLLPGSSSSLWPQHTVLSPSGSVWPTVPPAGTLQLHSRQDP